MKKIIILLLLSFLFNSAFSQEDTLNTEIRQKNRYVIGLLPSSANNIYGVAIGLIGSDAVCNVPYIMRSNGVNIQIIGQGIFQTFFVNRLGYESLYVPDEWETEHADTVYRWAKHNGILLSTFGTFTNEINGMSLSCWMSMGKKVNGVSCNLLWNSYEKINGLAMALVNHTGIINGLQFGLINKTTKLKGIQIGIWNKNDKRGFPIINWCFKE